MLPEWITLLLLLRQFFLLHRILGEGSEALFRHGINLSFHLIFPDAVLAAGAHDRVLTEIAKPFVAPKPGAGTCIAPTSPAGLDISELHLRHPSLADIVTVPLSQDAQPYDVGTESIPRISVPLPESALQRVRYVALSSRLVGATPATVSASAVPVLLLPVHLVLDLVLVLVLELTHV